MKCGKFAKSALKGDSRVDLSTLPIAYRLKQFFNREGLCDFSYVVVKPKKI